MDSLHNTYPDHVSLVAVHNGDPMKVTAYDAWMGTKIGGYPDVVVDRRETMDPSDLIDMYNREKGYFGFADLSLTPIDAGGFNISLKATVRPAMDLPGEYRLALVITEDEVHGTGSTWGQSNYYSGGNYGPLHGAGFEWENEPSVVPASRITYKFVARGIYPSTSGASGSLPSGMTAGNSYDYTFNLPNIPQPYNRANMKYVVMLIRDVDGAVLNSNNAAVTAGIKNVDAGIENVILFPNPAKDNLNLLVNMKEATTASADIIDITGRAISTVQQKMNAGSNKMEINTSGLPAGTYMLKLQTEKGSISERFSVAK
jgi:hypothetical protein